MKTLFGATVGLGAIAAAASAFGADLPMKRAYTKAPPAVVATVYDWSGFYVGFNAGGGSSRNCWNLISNAGVAVNPAANREGCNTGGGAAVGGQVGYRYQMANWVFGVEAQGDWANFNGTSAEQRIHELEQNPPIEQTGGRIQVGPKRWNDGWNNVSIRP